MFAILMAEKMSGTSVKIIKNEVGCRDDTVPKTVGTRGTARRIESMQQSSATQSLHLWFLGVAEDCCMLSILLAVPLVPTVFGTVSSLHPTSFLMIFTLVLNVMMWTVLQGASTVVTSSLVQMSKTALRCWQFQFRVCYVQKFITGNSHC